MNNVESRKIARDFAYKLVFEYLFVKEINHDSLEKSLAATSTESNRDYISEAYIGVIEHYDELIEVIKKYARRFALERIYKSDLAALLLAIYEMKYIDNIPLSVSISEAVELVKLYSTEKSNKFVNGLLSSVFKELSEPAVAEAEVVATEEV
ncbi:MAG: transcription antitermination factor NusB [Bacillota bacterium]